jgi:toll-like receptor 13
LSAYAYDLNFTNNKITELKFREYFASSKIARFGNNRIQLVDNEAMAALVNVSALYLQDNQLTGLPEQIKYLNFPNLQEIHLYNNPWSCDCHSSWMKSWLLQSLGNKAINVQGLVCRTGDIRNGRRLVDIADSDFVCGHILSTSEILLCSAGVLTVVIILVISGMYMKRKWLFSRFKLHPFDVDECTGEDMSYDVFVSGAHEDDCVLSELVTQLKRLGYAVCYHKNDFVPGHQTAENIGNAIFHSKRVVCYLSRYFIQSNWCMSEFECAFSLDLEHGRRRLIVIKDASLVVSDIIEQHLLRFYMSVYTYVEYGSERFMDNLTYSLPLHKLGVTGEGAEDGAVVSDNAADEHNDETVPLLS